MPRHSGFAMAFLLTISTSLPATPAGAAALDTPDVKWRQGPVKYLLTRDEDAQFRKLKSDDERKAFIEQFWSRRDPSEGTAANEFKDLFSKRLAMADQRFGGGGGEGWEDDRGKAVLLIGPPDRIEMHQSEAAAGGAPQGPPGAASPDASSSAPLRRATFIYDRPVLPGATAPLKLEFTEESGGVFRIIGRFDFTDPRLTGLSPLPLPAAPPPPPPPSEPATTTIAPEPIPEAPPTPQHELMEEIIAGPTPASKIPIAARLDFFKTKDAGTLGTLTLAVKKPAQGEISPVVAARLTGPDEKVALKLEKDDSFTAAPENAAVPAGADLLYQAGHDLAPGKYSLVAALKDPGTGDSGFVLQNVEVPDFHDPNMGLSSVTLARKVERLSEPADPSRRFVLGKFKILPAPRSAFKAGEEIWLYYQIYNTANDPASGLPKIKISYRFEKVEKTGNRLLGGRPIELAADNNVQAYSVTVQPAWPAGDYRVVMKVDDVIAGTSASATIPFTVVK